MLENVRAQASLLAVAIITITTVAAFETASDASYIVGESGGSWDLRTNHTAWASTITFRPNDQLVFMYNALAHDVVEVTQAAYRNCSASIPVSAALRTGNDTVLLDAASRRSSCYFICSTPGHCDARMKLEIRISTRAPSPPTGCRRHRGQLRTICSGSPPVVITTPAVVDNSAAPRSLAGLGSVLATVLMCRRCCLASQLSSSSMLQA